ncbi:hypothetical protein [Bradyrhizobium erythrophlei]|uniref:Uncharacterized protein n=1 Tax=Bradyrhizobium erythrophlei TaxID=1437360 RepID=A0A1M7UGD5_9BRAD|nr:hypothetical protein [Bradyrhizobium erythrophlei]SHN81965.1 hypothetical protein SAMN05444170_4958 [Bradyrhizobium erythrophlei]
MSAEIIPFVPQTCRERRPLNISHLFRSRPRENDLVMDHADAAPCEILPTHETCEDDVS